jgi:N-acetylneuraminate synthase
MQILKNKVTIIAECGVNHNGDLGLAKEMIHVAYEANADYVKFQTYKTENLIKKDCPMAQYQIDNLEEQKSQFDMLKKYELSEDNFCELYEYSQNLGIKFLSTPFDIDSLEFLYGLGLKTIKISSGDLTNAPLLLKASKKDLSLILSTGMATLEEIDAALSVVYWGYYSKKEPTSYQEILDFSNEGFSKDLYEKVHLLHCLSDYPAPVEKLNLQAIKVLKDRYAIPIGYSDHTLGTHIPSAAVALGACVIEKHFTLDRALPGPDHKASLVPEELISMVQQIRDIELAIGDGIKSPTENEKETSKLVRKGLYAKNFIASGQNINDDDIICLRPETRSSPVLFWDFVNQKASKDFNPGDPL